jgi:hypothetical protein
MESVQIRFTTTVTTGRHGEFNEGDILVTDAEYAAHLVRDCQGAEYTNAKDDAPEKSADLDKSPEPEPRAPKRAAKHKQLEK